MLLAMLKGLNKSIWYSSLSRQPLEDVITLIKGSKGSSPIIMYGKRNTLPFPLNPKSRQ